MKTLHVNINKIGIVSLFLAALSTLSPFATDSYLAAMPDMATYFGISIHVVELTVTLYFLGFAVGNFFGGPLSDAFGRKYIAMLGVVLYGLSALSIPFCSSIDLILLLRFTQAFGGGFATVTSNLFIKDWYKEEQVARLITITSMITMLAPLIAPILGSVLIHYGNWTTVFYFMALFALVLFTSFSLCIPESRKPEYITKKITLNQFFEKYKLFFLDKTSVLLLLAVSLSFSGLFVFITSASFIYLEYFKVKASYFSIFFGANIVLNIIFSFSNTFLLKRYHAQTLLQTGLIIQCIAGFLLYLIVQFNMANLWNVFVLIVLFIGSLGLIFGNGAALILGLRPELSGSANAAIGITRFLLGFALGTLIALFHTNDLMPIAIAMFGCTLSANVFFIWYKTAHNKALRLKFSEK
ncbi:multidrug effflux MFS transporter [Formosa haliotis]|uniref:multidrug effflux MFS transporter n=1 Tax=Formosa haliotis TaxID=1555194 RepID=UPI000824BC24|nr:multidrug effflux MFS transporter [Formosa haliotis]